VPSAWSLSALSPQFRIFARAILIPPLSTRIVRWWSNMFGGAQGVLVGRSNLGDLLARSAVNDQARRRYASASSAAAAL
jgi:hypothetical protein